MQLELLEEHWDLNLILNIKIKHKIYNIYLATTWKKKIFCNIIEYLLWFEEHAILFGESNERAIEIVGGTSQLKFYIKH